MGRRINGFKLTISQVIQKRERKVKRGGEMKEDEEGTHTYPPTPSLTGLARAFATPGMNKF